MSNKRRLDLILFEKGLAESREKAKAIIMSGIVFVNNQKSDKPGNMVPEDAVVEVRGKTLPYVSRGGLKLEKAMSVFPIDLKDKISMDVGASTGGFSDCMLQNGASKVYAVDVGYGQLAYKLRIDNRIVNLERTNIRYLEKTQVPDIIEFASIDVSFISLKLVLPAIQKFLTDGSNVVCLIKPQFEAGKEFVGKNGVIRDKKVHQRVIEEVVTFAQNNGYEVLGLDYSPVKGPQGNIEYLLYLERNSKDFSNVDVDVNQVVIASHNELDK